MHVQYACHIRVCVPPAFVCVPACFARVNSLYIHVCVSVALQQWRHQDTWHHTDVTQRSTLQDASDSLTWKMRHRREHQPAARTLNPTSAYCCSSFLQNCDLHLLLWKKNWNWKRDTAQVACSCTQIIFFTVNEAYTVDVFVLHKTDLFEPWQISYRGGKNSQRQLQGLA